MLRFQWNALRAGDKVIVHDMTTPDLALIGGTVALVDSGASPYRIAIRVNSDGERTNLIRPSRLSVHLDPIDESEPCWRCEELVATP